MEKIMKILILFSLLIFITACSDEKSEANVEPEQTSTSKVERSFDFAQLTHGGQLFQQNCAECYTFCRGLKPVVNVGKTYQAYAAG